ncbi:MAG: AmmeMemoRadiSam system protein A [Anaerolineae bacterium]|nr:AmmeMemoRadiSam system protein A [Anaerolineae bacterium]
MSHHPIVELARAAIAAYVRTGRIIEPPTDLPPELPARAAVFVSLHTPEGDLRGCIGTVAPTEPTLAEQVIQEAVAAAVMDPRFPPVEPEEIDGLDIHVDILNPPEPAESLADLDPKRYGVIVESGRRRGLLLPDIAGVDTAETQVALTRRKAGIGNQETVRLSRFTVTRLT